MQSTKMRISVAVEHGHVNSIRNCVMALPHENFTITPIMSGWRQRGYQPSAYGFKNIGQHVMVSFTTEQERVRPLLTAGFGLWAGKILQIGVTPVREKPLPA